MIGRVRIVDWLGLLLGCLGHFLADRLSRLYRRDPSIWVFGARFGAGFEDNAKYLYLHVAATHPEIRPVLLSTDRETVAALQRAGYEAYHTYSPRGLALNLRAGAVFVTHSLRDVSFGCSGGALAVMLWHGVPLKRISWDAQLADEPLPVRLAHRYADRRIDLVTVTNESLVDRFSGALGVDPDRIVVTGYPRNDALLGRGPEPITHADLDAAERVRRIARDRPTFVYLPTFRDGPGVAERIDFERLDRFLASVDASLIVKTHPAERLDLGDGLERIVGLPASVDVYPLLRFADGLITDYSSVYVDYLLLDRPIVFYAPDLESYREERDFYHDYDAVTPGPVARDFEELLDALERTAADGFAAERRAARERFVRPDTESRSEAVCEAVRARL